MTPSALWMRTPFVPCVIVFNFFLLSELVRETISADTADLEIEIDAQGWDSNSLFTVSREEGSDTNPADVHDGNHRLFIIDKMPEVTDVLAQVIHLAPGTSFLLPSSLPLPPFFRKVYISIEPYVPYDFMV